MEITRTYNGTFGTYASMLQLAKSKKKIDLANKENTYKINPISKTYQVKNEQNYHHPNKDLGNLVDTFA